MRDMARKSARTGIALAKSERAHDYSEAKGMLSRFELLIEDERAERVLEKTEELDSYFEKLKEVNPKAYLATDSHRKRIAERMIEKFGERLRTIA